MKVTAAIKALRERSGLSMEDAARLGGWRTASGYQRYEDESEFKKRYLPMEIAEKLSRAFVGKGYPPVTTEDIMALTAPKGLSFDSGGGVSVRLIRIVGVVEAGVWREAEELPLEEQQVFPIPALAGYENMSMFGLLVRGPSMNKVYPDGSIAFCVRVPDLEPRLGDIVVVRAQRGGLYETTLKEFGRDNKGRQVLHPRSTDPAHQRPILLENVGAEAVEVIGVAVWKSEPIPRPVHGKRQNP